jgi:hypothetical protein
MMAEKLLQVLHMCRRFAHGSRHCASTAVRGQHNQVVLHWQHCIAFVATTSCWYSKAITCTRPACLQLPERVHQLSANASQVLFDFDRANGYQYAPLRGALQAAAGRGKAVPLKPLMHR